MERKNVTLVFPDRSSATIDVIHLGPDRYRVADPCIAICSEKIGFNDIVEAIPDTEGRLVINRVIEQASFRTYEYCLPEGWTELPALKEVLKKVQEQGGEWAGVFGGVLLVCLPPQTEYDQTNEIWDGFRRQNEHS